MINGYAINEKRLSMSPLNSMTEEEKAYWALILMAKYVKQI